LISFADATKAAAPIPTSIQPTRTCFKRRYVLHDDVSNE